MSQDTSTLYALTAEEVKDLRALRADVKEMLEAWKAATKTLAFIKFLAGASSLIGAAWAIFGHLLDKR